MTYFLAIANQAEEAIERVRELHQKDGDYCSSCWNRGGTYAGSTRSVYPCPTIQALDGEE